MDSSELKHAALRRLARLREKTCRDWQRDHPDETQQLTSPTHANRAFSHKFGVLFLKIKWQF